MRKAGKQLCMRCNNCFYYIVILAMHSCMDNMSSLRLVKGVHARVMLGHKGLASALQGNHNSPSHDSYVHIFEWPHMT